jgi:polar amino acid transport system substrate-binding protein
MISAPSQINRRAILAVLSAAAIFVGVDPTLAQQPASAQVAPKGELRVAFLSSNPTLATRSAEGQYSGVAVDLANALGKKLELPVKLVPYENTVRYNQSIGKDEWDIAFSPRDLSRVAQLAFCNPFMEIDNSFVVRPGATARTPDELDHPGIKIAVAQGSIADGYLTRTIKRATIVRLFGGMVTAREALTSGRADAYADYTHAASRLAAEVPGATVLVSHFNVVPITIAVLKGNAAALSIINDFLKEAIRDGVVAEAIKRAGLTGARARRG